MVSIIDFNVSGTDIDGLMVCTPKQVTDERGTIRELFRRSAFEVAGIELAPFQQINVTQSAKGAVRGMHAEQMTKLCTVVTGEAFGAWIDLRATSATFGNVVRLALLPGVHQVLVPAGVANGFQTVSESSQYVYCFDTEWRPDLAGVRLTPHDDERAYGWPIPIDVDDRSQISTQDLGGPTWAEWSASQ